MSFRDLEFGDSPIVRALPFLEQVKHTVLLLQLQRPYFLYCVVCSILAAAAFASTIFDLVGEPQPGRRWHDVLEGGTWQSACWSAVGLALCIEVACTAAVRWAGGFRALLEDPWLAFDTSVVCLTVLAWLVINIRRASPMREEAEEVDLWLLMLRFALQPCRVIVAAKMAHKAQKMQKSHMDVDFDVLAGFGQHGGMEFRTTSSESPFEATADSEHVFWA